MFVASACTDVYPEKSGLASFMVALSPDKGQKTGSEEKPMNYVSGTSCAVATCPVGEECLGYCGVSGLSCAEDLDCPTGEYCTQLCARPIFLDISALGVEGNSHKMDGEYWVHLKVVPGMIPAPYEFVKLVNGKAKDVPVYIAQTFGESFVWVEDIGDGYETLGYGECNNGKDDDGDGWIDLADPNCLDPSDPKEAAASYATGISPALFFEAPRVWHLQYTDQVARSPLAGQNVYVESGDLVVTNVVANGFFVTDMDHHKAVLDNGNPGYFNSFFLYTFNKPEGVRYGDIVCSFSGGVVEYEGNTQMTFPTPVVADKDAEEPCENREVKLDTEVPDPVDVTDLLVPEDPESKDYRDQVMANAISLEPFESGLIKVSDVEVSNRFIACDADENGQYPSNSDDDTCRDECQIDPYCTQLESFFKYSQMTAYANAGKKIYLGIDMLKDKVPLEVPYIGAGDVSGNCPDLIDPDTGEVLVENPHKVVIGDTLYIEYLCPPTTFESVTGNFRHIYLCNDDPGKQEGCTLQMTMLIPRFDEDFEFEE